jgi:alkylation response protein AidB-like acyl-CoA dehydrogenase
MECLVDFDFDAEQEELRAVVRDFLAETSTDSEVRRLMDTEDGFDRSVWRRMAKEIGLQGLAVPERFGGAGAGMVEVGLVLEELGRSLACTPYFASTVLATTTLLLSGDEDACASFLPGLAAGDTIATLALTEASGRWDRDGVALTARPTSTGWSLNGHKSFVLDGEIADLVLTVALTPDGVGIFLVLGDAEGLARTAQPTLDPTRRQARLDYTEVAGVPLGHPDGWALVSQVLEVAAAGLAAEQVGVAGQALDMAVEYAKVRHQFGRPIGSFQAVKHMLADVLLEVESARAAAYFALLAADRGDADLPTVAHLAKAFCSEACLRATEDNIQVHGGIGFTWEHPAHLYLKRARTSQVLLGDPAYHRELLAQRIGLPGA